jgi:D-3-phosphoglycerate dehydrogenase
LFNGASIDVEIETISVDSLLQEADFISLHVPAQKDYVIDTAQFDLMKDGAVLINAARGGVVNEVALVDALDSKKLSFAGLDTFENEPKPEIKLLMHPKISLTPHIGAATLEAQDRIGQELADQIISILK